MSASPGVAWVVSVSDRASSAASAASSPLILTAPRADAVVTVTVPSRSSCCSGPCSVSTVCTREIGAIRHSRTSQPESVYTASSVTSQRWMR